MEARVVNRQLVNERNYLHRAIDRDREELRQAVAHLRTVAHERVESLRVGHHVAARPLPYIVGGFLLGMWLGWSPTEDL